MTCYCFYCFYIRLARYLQSYIVNLFITTTYILCIILWPLLRILYIFNSCVVNKKLLFQFHRHLHKQLKYFPKITNKHFVSSKNSNFTRSIYLILADRNFVTCKNFTYLLLSEEMFFLNVQNTYLLMLLRHIQFLCSVLFYDCRGREYLQQRLHKTLLTRTTNL